MLFFNITTLFRKKFLFLTCMILSLSPYFAFASELESPQNIKEQIDTFIKKTIAIQKNETMTVDILHPEILSHLSKCNTPIDIHHSNSMNTEKSASIELSCTDNPGWKKFVPIKIAILSPILVAKKNISAGELMDSNTEIAQVDKNELAMDFFIDDKQLIGKIAAQPITAGSVITNKMLKNQAVIQRNQTVHVSVLNGSVNLQMDGIAKSDAVINEMVRIENPVTKKVFEAIATGPGEAKIII